MAGCEKTTGSNLCNNQENGKEYELTTKKKLEEAGYAVVSNVKVFYGPGENDYAMADHVAVKEDGSAIALVESKYEADAKLSSNQKSLFEVAAAGGELRIANPEVNFTLGLSNDKPLGGQGKPLFVAVDASSPNARALRQFARTMRPLARWAGPAGAAYSTWELSTGRITPEELIAEQFFIGTAE